MKPNIFPSPTRCASAFTAAAFLLVFGVCVAFGDDTESVYTEEECIECHRTGSEESDLFISVQDFNASAHADETACQDCHTGVVDEEHQSVEGSGAVDCGECHEQENRHGPSGQDEERPQCHDCHSRHRILKKDDPASAVHTAQLPITCGACHPVASGKENFFSWFTAFQIASHNKADFGSAYEKDNCLGCHQGAGAHGESEAINEQTCNRCHFSPEAPGAMWGRMHPEANMQTQPSVFAAASIYQASMVIGLVLLAIKLWRKRRLRLVHKTETLS